MCTLNYHNSSTVYAINVISTESKVEKIIFVFICNTLVVKFLCNQLKPSYSAPIKVLHHGAHLLFFASEPVEIISIV